MPHIPYFLEEVAHDLYHQYHQSENNFTRCLVILPTSQGAAAFQQVLLDQQHDPQYLPAVVTLEAWVVEHSRIQVAPTLGLVTLLYECLQDLQPTKETFEQFYGWGCMLLQDFDIIDKCLVDAEQLFANLYEQKILTPTYEQLSAAQKEAIQSFWNTFGTRLSTQQEDFLRFWKLLPELYTTFIKRLVDQGKGYAGLCYSMLCDHLDNDFLTPYQQVAVIGFNALHPAEEKIFAWLHAQLPTRFYWDIDAYYMEDDKQEAGRHFRAHHEKPYFQTSFKQPYPTRIQSIPKQITLIESNTEVGQVHVVGKQIEELLQTQGKELNPYQIAIVLANEELLVPLLQALPADYQSIYSTVGYPIIHTSTYQLIDQVLEFQTAIIEADFPPAYFPSSEVIQLLQQPAMRAYDPSTVIEKIQMLIKEYPHQVPKEALIAVNTLYEAVFKPALTGIETLAYLQSILALLGEEQVSSLPREVLEKQAIKLLQEQLTHLQQYPQLFVNLSIDQLMKFFRQFIQSLRITEEAPVIGKGISILRIWETANLDFEQVFIMGMSEGMLPAKNKQGSFIPYNLRRAYGLPTIDTFQASLDAYYFYRLLQRAQQVHITYSISTGISATKERSRYLWQLVYESKLPIEQHTLTTTIYNTTIHPIIIQKDLSVLAALQHYLVTPGQVTRTLTPAALNTYLDCSLQFYFRYVLALHGSPRLPDEGIEAVRFGRLVHEVVEQLYTTLQGTKQGSSLIQRLDITSFRQQITSLIDTMITPTQQRSIEGGESIIEREVVQKVVDQLLTLDEAYAPFELIGMEVGRKEPLTTHFKLPDGKQFVLRGVIDRIDRKEGVVRVIDYKTGSDNTYAERISSLFRKNSQRNKAFLQTFFYAWLLQRQEMYQLDQVRPILVNTRAIFEPDFDPRFKLSLENPNIVATTSIPAKEYVYIDAVSPYQQEFEAGLEVLLSELLDPKVPFLQTDNQQICAQCPYNRICQRA